MDSSQLHEIEPTSEPIESRESEREHQDVMPVQLDLGLADLRDALDDELDDVREVTTV
jgi:hypothetical protein